MGRTGPAGASPGDQPGDDARGRGVHRAPAAEREAHKGRARTQPRAAARRRCPSRAMASVSSTGRSASGWLAGHDSTDETIRFGCRAARLASSRPAALAAVGPSSCTKTSAAASSCSSWPCPRRSARSSATLRLLRFHVRNPGSSRSAPRRRRLHLDHVRADLGQQHGGDRTGDAGRHIDDADAVENPRDTRPGSCVPLRPLHDQHRGRLPKGGWRRPELPPDFWRFRSRSVRPGPLQRWAPATCYVAVTAAEPRL